MIPNITHRISLTDNIFLSRDIFTQTFRSTHNLISCHTKPKRSINMFWESFIICLLVLQKTIQRKLVVVGDGACGKTSLLNVFTRGYFPQVYEPTVFENYIQDVVVDGKTIQLSIWDTAGQEEFDRLRSLSYNDTHVIIVCYSIDNRDSLENIPNRWIEELQEGCPQAKTILVALKCDLRDDEVALKKIKPVLYEEGLEVAKKIHAIRYLECSAKHNRGVRECFEQAAKVSTSVTLECDTSNKSCVIL